MNLYYLLLTCFGAASLALFFQKCQEEGMIFEWYGNLIRKLPDFLYSPLGGCEICNGTWIFIVLFLVEGFEYCCLGSSLVELFLGIGINYIFIEILSKVINK
jgi:hypothetical protein